MNSWWQTVDILNYIIIQNPAKSIAGFLSISWYLLSKGDLNFSFFDDKSTIRN